MDIAPVSVICAIAFLLNLPFGYYREGVARFSVRWFAAIHLPIPFVVALRLIFQQGWRVIPFLFVAAIIGQLAGGFFRVKMLEGRS